MDNVLRARRAVGAMFFAPFGGAWMALWWYRAVRPNWAVLALIVAGAAALLGRAYARYRRGAAQLRAEPETDEKCRRDRWFHIINGGQWVVILIAGNVLANVGLGEWVLPMAMFVVGLHFLPLARIFGNRANFVTGAALMALAAVYPVVAAGGARNPVGCLGTGLVLWASALWAVVS